MNNLPKAFVVGVIALSFLGGLAFFGLTPFKSVNTVVQQLAGSSATGSTFQSAKVAAVVFAPATGTATSSSILNTDANDRIILDAFVTCNTLGTSFTAYTGAGLLSAGLIFTAATTSTANPVALGNTNLALNVPIATTTANVSYVATSTYTNIQARVWAAGSYMTFASNATNTAVCTPGVHYVAQ